MLVCDNFVKLFPLAQGQNIPRVQNTACNSLSSTQVRASEISLFGGDNITITTGCLRKNALLGFLNPWDRLMPVVTIVLVKVVGGMLDDD